MINDDPNIVGYWSRVHKLTANELREDSAFHALLAGWNDTDWRNFAAGVTQAREEIEAEELEEKLRKLRESLAEAYSSAG